MPILTPPVFRPTFPFTSGHAQTIGPTLCRQTPQCKPKSQRIETDDGDFLDIDLHPCSSGPTNRLAVISHGLEGNARKKYMLGMARMLSNHGWDVICLNFRGCSGVPNRLPRLYHSGVTDDLHQVLCHGLAMFPYTVAALVGFSMGGNQTLKYLGENPDKVPPQVAAAVTVSVPCALRDSVEVMEHWSNRLYMHYFMVGLKEKVKLKTQAFPHLYSLEGLAEMKTFFPFDDKYTGPIHGFDGALDYYRRCSSLQFIPSIRVPTLLVQADDDPFLAHSCYPYAEAEANCNFFLEIPRYGGHVGFMDTPWHDTSWSEQRTLQFFKEMVP